MTQAAWIRYGRAWTMLACLATGCQSRETGGGDTVGGERADSAGREATLPVALWLVPPAGERALIDTATTERQLIARFGAENVRYGRAEVGEGETLPATIVYPADSLRRLEVFWKDTVARARPARLRIGGRRSAWRAAPDVGLGTSLEELERANGRPFTLAGFGWDYAGTVTSWEGGRLDSLPPGVERLLVRLTPPESASVMPREMMEVTGDRDFPSTHPVMRKLDPRAYAVEVLFR